jgi:hypothetical protein
MKKEAGMREMLSSPWTTMSVGLWRPWEAWQIGRVMWGSDDDDIRSYPLMSIYGDKAYYNIGPN